VPETAEAKAARKALARAAERRRRAVAELRLAESMCGYAAAQLANGLSAEQARLAALETAGELVAVAAVLRRAAWTTTADRRRLAALMAGRGLPTGRSPPGSACPTGPSAATCAADRPGARLPPADRSTGPIRTPASFGRRDDSTTGESLAVGMGVQPPTRGPGGQGPRGKGTTQ
jgi:hypothetical protein